MLKTLKTSSKVVEKLNDCSDTIIKDEVEDENCKEQTVVKEQVMPTLDDPQEDNNIKDTIKLGMFKSIVFWISCLSNHRLCNVTIIPNCCTDTYQCSY